MEEHSPRNILKTVLIVIAAFVVMILYVFISSAAGRKHSKGVTADMYGMDSLEYVGEPVMKIFVWQKNEEDSRTNERYLSGSSYFYDLVPLTLTEGEKISTDSNLFDNQKDYFILITAEYDGEIYGEYDLKARGYLTYTGSKEAVPGVQYGGNSGGKTGSTPEFKQDDSSFSSNKIVTLSIQPLKNDAVSIKKNQWSSTQEYLFRGYGVDLNDYITKEQLHDIYPDAPEELQDLYRYVVTTHVTIHAKHPTKTDVTVATAVLEVRQISEWQGTDGETRQILRETKCYEENYTEIVVESYEQSDMFAFE